MHLIMNMYLILKIHVIMYMIKKTCDFIYGHEFDNIYVNLCM